MVKTEENKMSAKTISSVSDENQDFHKQYGCMNGIFQLFDRHYFITGKRVSTNNKRLLPVPGAEHGAESKTATTNVMVREIGTESKTATAIVMEKNVKIVKDEPRISVESPRKSSSSSSRSSTFPLPDLVKTEECKPIMINQVNHLDHPAQVPTKQTSSSMHSNHQANEHHNAVKNSIRKERSGLSVKTAVKEKGGSHVMKHVDSPRPLPLSKPSYSRITGFDASPRALTKIQDSPRNSMDQMGRKDLPRFSLDGRETRDTYKSVTKLKEFPRFSLDSRESSLRSSLSESRLNLLRDLTRENITIGARPSNVVVKLMGLEAFPGSNSDHLSQDQEFDNSSPKKSNKTNESQILTRKDMQKDPASPSMRNDGSLIEPSSPSKFPVEQAPWKQPNGSHHPLKKAQKSLNVCMEAKITSSVYGEMEERLSELEFTKYGKDLRALKQILEAMQKTRKRSDDEQQEEQSESEPQTARCSSPSSTPSNQISKALNLQRTRSNKKDPNSPQRSDSPKAIAKKPGPVDTSHILKFKNREDLVVKVALKDEAPRNNCRSLAYKKNMNNALKPVLTSRAPLKAENFTAFDRNPASLSPRFQANNQRTQKQSPAATQANEGRKARNNSTRKPTESDKSPRKTRTNQQRSKSKPSSYNDVRSFAHLDDSSSLQSDSNSSASQIENEVTSTGSSTEITPKQHIHSKERQIAARLYEDKPMAELTVATERPSPISVLDATFCLEDSPSPVKKISISFQDFEAPDSDKAELYSLNISSSNSRSRHHEEFDKREPEHAKHLIYSTGFPSVTPDTASWEISGNLHMNPKVEYDYIAKILSATGLLKNMGPFIKATQPQSLGQVINPDFFHVLEQTEQSAGLQDHIGKFTIPKDDQKIHRRMLFDTVNEIIFRKMVLESPLMLQKRIKTEQERLREIFLEIDNLQAKTDCDLDDLDGLGSILSADMKRQPDDWENMQSEIPAMVLDIERMIFKDLITEVLNGESLSLHDIPGKQRKLFF